MSTSTTIGTPRACTPLVTVDCNLNVKATVEITNNNWVAYLQNTNGLVETMPVQPDGVTFVFTAALIENEQYSVTYSDVVAGTLGCGYSTVFTAIKGRVTKDCASGGCYYSDSPCNGTTSTTTTTTTTTKPKGKGKK